MTVSFRLPALSAACALLLLATDVGAVRAEPHTDAASVTAMSRDNPAQVRTAIGNFLSLRPKARDEAAAAAPKTLDLASLDAMPQPGAGGDDQRCLAEAIYFESRGEPFEGQVAVAEVVLNRVDDRQFPGTVCAVTNQGVGSGRACQFSYACDGRSDVMKSAEPRIRAEKLAAVMLAGHPRAVTDGAIYFHSRAVRPGWAGKMMRTTAIGHHLFYRPATRVASN